MIAKHPSNQANPKHKKPRSLQETRVSFKLMVIIFGLGFMRHKCVRTTTKFIEHRKLAPHVL